MGAWRGGLRQWLRAAAVLAALCLAGCARGHDDTLVFWTFGPEGEAVAGLLPDFERAHPDIHVEVQQLPLSAAHQKLLTAIAGGTTPDMAQLGNTWLPEMVALHALAPLQRDVAASRAVAPPDYFASIWATNVSGGQLYGIPWYVDTRLLFYRRDLLQQAGFDAPPRDWAEWRRMLAALSHPARKVYGILLPTNEYEQLLSLALQQPDPLLRDDDSRGNFESAGFRRALAFYVDTFRLQQAPVVTNVEVANPWAEFGNGVYAFYLSGPWNVGEFRKRLPASEQGDWATAPLPGPDGPGAGLAGGASLVVFRASKHRRAAWALVEYLSQPQVQQRFYRLTGDMPPRRSSWDSPLLQNDAAMHAFRDQLERVKPTPAIPEWERIAVMMQQVAARAVAGELSVDQAAVEMDRRADLILAKRRALLHDAEAKR
ncbi:sugar ABC transporter substrate-binding protein [Rhodanobacter sp. DHB23]|uniref:sugar ABC transporter substrate-binding protein n=1 Tax=Rhodanobacter sp. DHB23 TaxID=2775923 RepID=UPI00177F99BB|nr:sugar ABC transporter substrate-binding protein [Rhodanobacter sp. DHB23]MBD8872688.1 sugar ABC transporter substrate-binding protein [Rhodanobacter sp. DHB23]